MAFVQCDSGLSKKTKWLSDLKLSKYRTLSTGDEPIADDSRRGHARRQWRHLVVGTVLAQHARGSFRGSNCEKLV